MRGLWQKLLPIRCVISASTAAAVPTVRRGVKSAPTHSKRQGNIPGPFGPERQTASMETDDIVAGVTAGSLAAAAATAYAVSAVARQARRTSPRTSRASTGPSPAAATVDDAAVGTAVRSTKRSRTNPAKAEAEPAAPPKPRRSRSKAAAVKHSPDATASAAAGNADAPATPSSARAKAIITSTSTSTPPATTPVATSSAAPAQAAPTDRPMLLDLGSLVTGHVIKRPSATMKTPYVADVQLTDGTMVLAHAPAMDCAGMITPASQVHMTVNNFKDDGRVRTTHAIQVVEDLREGGGVALVGSHPQLAEKLAAQLVQRRLVQEVGDFSATESQKTFGNTRVDYVLRYEDGSRLLLEVKNVVCADFPADGVPPGRPAVGVYTSDAKPYERTAIFPHGAKKKAVVDGRKVDVVSDRAIKHLHELTQLQQQGCDHDGNPVRCAVLFVVNRGDCTSFRPCHEADMLFANVLRRAEQQGVLVLAYDVQWCEGQAFLGKRLPVRYGEGVTGEVDEEHLQLVLKFNATDPRTHWKKAKKG